MGIIKKDYIKVNRNNEELDEDFEVMDLNEEEGFLKRNKKGLIIGGICALAAGATALIVRAVKKNKSSDEDYEDDWFDEDDESDQEDEKTE